MGTNKNVITPTSPVVGIPNAFDTGLNSVMDTIGDVASGVGSMIGLGNNEVYLDNGVLYQKQGFSQPTPGTAAQYATYNTENNLTGDKALVFDPLKVQTQDFGLSMGDIMSGFNMAGNAYLGLQGLGLEQDKFEFNKKMGKANYNANAQQANMGIDRYNAINQALAAKRKRLNQDTSYVNKKRIKEM